MKKTLIALAVAGMFVASAANAQSSNVTLYGRINLDLETVSSATDDGLGESQRLQSNASRIGVRGSEDLGGGLKAIFQIESQFAGDAGGGSLASRDTWLGLEGAWGKLRFGHMLTPVDNLHAIFGNAPTFTTSILSTEALWTQNPYGNNWQFGQRRGNAVRYDSPNISGLQLQFQVTPLDESGLDKDGSIAFTLAGIYNNAGLQIGAGIEYVDWDRASGSLKHGGGNAYTSLVGANGKPASDTNPAVAYGGIGTEFKSDLQLTLTAGYDFGFIRPAAVVEYIKTENASYETNRLLYGLSVTAPVGTGKIYGAFIYADEWDSDGDNKSKFDGTDTGAWQAEVSYTYPLSKRTSVYAGYVLISNDDYAYYTFGSNGNKGIGDEKGKGINQQGLIFGMMHNF